MNHGGGSSVAFADPFSEEQEAVSSGFSVSGTNFASAGDCADGALHHTEPTESQMVSGGSMQVTSWQPETLSYHVS